MSEGYSVKELFYSLQGEGVQSGRPAVFCRFSGCNLWDGRPSSRETAQCRYCDTDFVGTDGDGGGRFAGADELATAIAARWPRRAGGRPFVVLTGGEPTLQVDEALCLALHRLGFEIAIESNGSRPVPAGIDWICISPKIGVPLQQACGNELKVVLPQPGREMSPQQWADWEALMFDHHLVQPLDDGRHDHRAAAAAWCLDHPRWRLSLQTHKVLGLP